MALQQAADKIAAEFEYPAEDVRRGVKAFLQEMSESGEDNFLPARPAADGNPVEKGLAGEPDGMNMIPTYVTAVPDGSEKVGFLASALPVSAGTDADY